MLHVRRDVGYENTDKRITKCNGNYATAVSGFRSSRTIISIEKGQYSPSLMLAYRMAQVFHTTVEDLCCLKENKEIEDKNYENL